MAGYSGFSMSNNAVDAYDRGLVPASKVGLGIPASLIAQYVRCEEWHHSSKHDNETKFYDRARVAAVFGVRAHPDYEANPMAIAALAAWKASRKAAPVVRENCTVEWIEWSGSFHNARADLRQETGCRVVIKGNTATITLADGSIFTKRLTTTGFRWTQGE